MAEKDRLDGKPFTCSNQRFHTNTTKGNPHGPGKSSGSVFEKPLVPGAYSLWLEHVVDKKNSSDTFWLMWYDSAGSPMIPLSGVISAEQIKDMASRLAAFIELDA